MKAIKLSILALPLTFVSCINCIEGTGDAVEEERSLHQFEELSIETSINVTLHQDRNLDQPKLVLNGQQNILDNIVTDVSGNVLEIDAEKCFNTNDVLEAHLYFAEIKEIDISGSGSLNSDGKIKGEDLELNIDGSGEVDLKVKYESLDTDINGSGDVTLRGNVVEHDAVINGSGDILAVGMKTTETELEINGSGSCEVHATESLDISVNGSGDVKYKGNPQHLNQQINGSGGVSTIK